MHEVSFRPGSYTSYLYTKFGAGASLREPSAFSKSLKSLHACGHSMFASIHSVKAKQNRPTESFARGSHRNAVDCSATITVTQARPSAPVCLGKIWTRHERPDHFIWNLAEPALLLEGPRGKTHGSWISRGCQTALRIVNADRQTECLGMYIKALEINSPVTAPSFWTEWCTNTDICPPNLCFFFWDVA